MPAATADKPTSLRVIRQRLVRLTNLERELLPGELAELWSLRIALRRELFSRISLEKR